VFDEAHTWKLLYNQGHSSFTSLPFLDSGS
jgi:hypothetical protein